MKAILMSIRPEWVAKILNGEKTIEIRRTAPKCELPITVYVYCTKGKIGAQFVHKMKRCFFGKFVEPMLNGKVVAKFTLRKVHKFDAEQVKNTFFKVRNSCLTNRELTDYAQGKDLYGWNISDLEIFDKPKELSEFDRWNEYPRCEKCPHANTSACEHCCREVIAVERAPQSMCYVEEKE